MLSRLDRLRGTFEEQQIDALLVSDPFNRRYLSGFTGSNGMLPAGLVLTGGAAQLAGAARLGREVLQMPVRVAGPSGVSGLTDHLLTPAYSTSLGLLIWGAQTISSDDSRSYESTPGPPGAGFGTPCGPPGCWTTSRSTNKLTTPRRCRPSCSASPSRRA